MYVVSVDRGRDGVTIYGPYTTRAVASKYANSIAPVSDTVAEALGLSIEVIQLTKPPK
jgi:hypothetical protein